jgi:hypothetical protein
MRKNMKNRSKLETPTSERDDESLASFVKKYEKRQEKVFLRKMRRICIRNPIILKMKLEMGIIQSPMNSGHR